MTDSHFRLRLNFQKRDRLRWLSHLELVRLLERIIRRAALPYVVSQGFNAHMRQAPGPALPVGTAGLDEYFDVWLGEYLKPEMALKRLRQATVPGLELLSASYVSPKARSLQASHLHERYQLLLKSGLPAATLEQGLQQLLDAKTLTVKRPHKSGGRGKPDKSYDLVTMVEGFTVSDSSPCDGGEGAAVLLVELHLKATEQGSLRPAVLLRAAIDELGGDAGWRILSVARTQLFEDGC